MASERTDYADIPYDQRVARWAVRYLVRTPLTPNMVTAGSIPIGLCAAYLLSEGAAAAHLGAAVFVLAVWLDHVDGELARQTGKSSKLGHYFDHVAAMICYVAGFVGAGIGLREGHLGEMGPWLGWTAGVSIASIMTIRVILELRDGRDSIRQGVYAGFEIEDTLYVVAPVVWFGLLEYFIVAAGIGAPLFLMYVLVDAIWLRRPQLRTEAPTEGGKR